MINSKKQLFSVVESRFKENCYKGLTFYTIMMAVFTRCDNLVLWEKNILSYYKYWKHSCTLVLVTDNNEFTTYSTALADQN